MKTQNLRAIALMIACFASLTPARLSAQEGPAAQPTAQVASLLAEPPNVEFGDAFEGELLTQTVRVSNDGERDWHVRSIQTSCGCTAAKIMAGGFEFPTRTNGNDPILTLEPGEEMNVVVEFRTAGKHGDVKQSMKVLHTDTSIPALEVGVHVRVTQGIQITPKWLNLNRISKSEKVEEIVVIESVEIGEWTVEGFESMIESQPLPEWIKFELLDKEGPRRRVRVELSGDRPVGALIARVKINIGHERITSADFSVSATVLPNVTFDTGTAAFQDNLDFGQMAPADKVTRTIKITNTEPDVPYELEAVDLLSKEKDFFVTAIREVEKGVSYEIDVTADGAIGAPFFRGSVVLRAKHPDLPNKMIPFVGWVRK
jgi:hypothetical protein